jgi:hypothetical protein
MLKFFLLQASSVAFGYAMSADIVWLKLSAGIVSALMAYICYAETV